MKLVTGIFAGCAAAVIGGCSSPSYPATMRGVKEQIEKDISAVPVPNGIPDNLLQCEETGRLLQIKGDWAGSSKMYRAAMGLGKYKFEEEPEISITDKTRHLVASTFGNDLQLDYFPSTFEQMMLHTLDAFNCLAQGAHDDFGINIRYIEAWRNEAKIHIDEESLICSTGKVSVSYGEQQHPAAPSMVKSSYDNTYALYLSALYREIQGDGENAALAYRDIAKILGSNAAKAVLPSTFRIPGDMGEVVVFFENGFIPEKSERHVNVQGGGLVNVKTAIPKYAPFINMQSRAKREPLVIAEGSAEIGRTKFLCDLAELAAKTLDEDMNGIIARGRVRNVLQTTLQTTLTAADYGAIAASSAGAKVGWAGPIISAGRLSSYIWQDSSERADLRSWLLLPRSVQVGRFQMKPGKHTLTLSSGEKTMEVVADVKPGQKTIVYCIAIPGVMQAFSANVGKNVGNNYRR